MNLIYFTISGNVNYVNLLDLCLKSLAENGSIEADLLFITTENLKSEIQKLEVVRTFTCHYQIESTTDLFHSSSNKLKVYKFEFIHKYDRILFLDCDMLIIGELNSIFDLCTPDEFCVSNEDLTLPMSDSYWGWNLFNEVDKEFIKANMIPGINGGIFLFPSSCIDDLQKIDELTEAYFRDHNDNLPDCLEQPFVNWYLFRNKYNTGLNPYVSHSGYKINFIKEKNNNVRVLHFCGGPGSYLPKIASMTDVYNQQNLINKNASITYISNRNLLLDVLPQNGVVAELGVFKGYFSEIILQTSKPAELHLIDIWEGAVDCGDKDGNNMEHVNDLYPEYVNLQNKYSNNENVNIHRGRIDDVLYRFPDDYFDWIYIDADHSYESVISDLETSYKKIKINGYITGHDYTPRFSGVVKAVHEFCGKHNLQIQYLTEDGCPSFAIQKS